MSKSKLIAPKSGYDAATVARLQALPLEQKINLAERRIRQFYESQGGRVYIAFSGGKDSTVLLHMVRSLYPDVPAVFSNTGLEFPEVVDFVKGVHNVEIIRPEQTFNKVVEEHGFPVPSKETARYVREARTTKSADLLNKRMNGKPRRDGKGVVGMIPHKWKFLVDAPFQISERCCDVMKKRPFHKYQKGSGRAPFIGIMAIDSRLRFRSIIRNGCNIVDGDKPQSRPMAMWTDDDVWAYIKSKGLAYSPIYDMGYDRTGCMFCMFGMFGNSGRDRFERMAETHPKQYAYCMGKLGLQEVIDYCEKGLRKKDRKQFDLDL